MNSGSRGDRERLKELLEACKQELPGCDVPHICHGAQKVLARVRSIETELDLPHTNGHVEAKWLGR